MTSQTIDTLDLSWGSTTAFSAELRAREFVHRVGWFIQMRWFAVVGCLIASLLVESRFLPVEIQSTLLWTATIILAVLNGLYAGVSRHLFREGAYSSGMRLFIRLQIYADFAVLAVISYACGAGEAPVLTLYVPHIILASLFFRRSRSLGITFGAWFFAAIPLVLETVGILPVHSLFHGEFKDIALAGPRVIVLLILFIGGCFFAIWYLTSEITTSLKLREFQLEESYETLTRMDREKTKATLRATHELKAPFAAIKSYVYTLRDGYCGELPEKAQEVVGRIGVRCDLLKEKITDIIHLGNLKSLVLTELDFTDVELTDLLKEEVREANLLGEPRKISTHLDLGEEQEIWIKGSRAHLHTLLSNLVRNAINYSRDQSVILVSLVIDNGQASVAVKDQGIGIPEDNLPKIFDEYFRSNNAVQHYASSSGLGLAMVKEIIRLHGASIQVKSREGEGSTFTVSFQTLSRRST